MKGKRLCVLVLAGALLLGGCGTSGKKENGKYILSSIDGKTILADDVYNDLAITTSGKTSLFSYVLEQLIKENFPVTDAMKENAKDIINNVKANYKNQYGDEADAMLERQLASGGYESIEAYQDDLISILQQAEFIKKYVKDNFDKVFEDYYKQENPRIISLIKIAVNDIDNVSDDEKEKVEEVKKLLKTDKSFGDIAVSYSDDTSKSAKGNIGIVDSTVDLKSIYGENVESKALSLKQDEVSDAIKGNDGYYFLKCTNIDKETIKNELKTVDIESPLLSYDDYIIYFAFQSYDLKYENEDAKKAVQEVIDDALKARNEERSKH